MPPNASHLPYRRFAFLIPVIASFGNMVTNTLGLTSTSPSTPPSSLFTLTKNLRGSSSALELNNPASEDSDDEELERLRNEEQEDMQVILDMDLEDILDY